MKLKTAVRLNIMQCAKGDKVHVTLLKAVDTSRFYRLKFNAFTGNSISNFVILLFVEK